MYRFKDLFTIIPILVGSLSPEREALYGRLLAPYMADSQTLFVISSDFCHWGQRFRYTYYDRSCGPIYRSIQNLDKMVCFFDLLLFSLLFWKATFFHNLKLLKSLILYVFIKSFFCVFIKSGYGHYRDFESCYVHGVS